MPIHPPRQVHRHERKINGKAPTLPLLPIFLSFISAPLSLMPPFSELNQVCLTRVTQKQQCEIFTAFP